MAGLKRPLAAGMFGEQVLTMRGKGAPARNKEGRPGNLLVGFSISPHPSFRRHGFDVHVDRSIDFVDAALGTQTRSDLAAQYVCAAIAGMSVSLF